MCWWQFPTPVIIGLASLGVLCILILLFMAYRPNLNHMPWRKPKVGQTWLHHQRGAVKITRIEGAWERGAQPLVHFTRVSSGAEDYDTLDYFLRVYSRVERAE